MVKINFHPGGKCRATVKGGLPESVVNSCAAKGIVITELERIDAHTLSFTLEDEDYPELEKSAEECMSRAEKTGEAVGRKKLRFLRRHLWLPLSAAAFLLLLSVSSLFIWDIDVVGNKRLTDTEIIRTLKDCGVDTGSFWPGIDRDEVRSRMIGKLPDIAWMSININGSRASVPILEREDTPDLRGSRGYSDISAAYDGIVERVSALNGKPLVSEGQSVRCGEILISGRVDSIDGSIEYMRAAGSVIARTMKEKTLVCPARETRKQSIEKIKTRFALKIGNRRINFYPNGRNTVDESDKIVHNHIIGIDKIFALPVTVITEKIVRYKPTEAKFSDTEGMKEYLISETEKETDGDILFSDVKFAEKDGLQYARLRCECIENIAKEDTANDRTDLKG